MEVSCYLLKYCVQQVHFSLASVEAVFQVCSWLSHPKRTGAWPEFGVAPQLDDALS